MKLGALALRAVIGPLFVGHGTQKLFGWFGGPGMDGVSGMMENLQLHPPRRHATMVALGETVGGALLTLGALTPLATTMLTSTMVTAIRKVHAANGVWNTGGGYEYNAVLIASMFALTDNGPGRLSVDRDRFRGPVWALAALGSGVAGSYLVTGPLNELPAPEPEIRTRRFERVREPVGPTA
jgi:putative oxidoreductase